MSVGGQPANQAQPVAGGSQMPTDGFMQQMLASFMGPQAKPSLGAVMQPGGMGAIMPPMPQVPSPIPPNAGGPMPPMPNMMGAFQQGSNAIAKQAATPFIKPPPRPTAAELNPPPMQGKPAGPKKLTPLEQVKKDRQSRIGGSNK